MTKKDDSPKAGGLPRVRTPLQKKMGCIVERAQLAAPVVRGSSPGQVNFFTLKTNKNKKEGRAERRRPSDRGRRHLQGQQKGRARDERPDHKATTEDAMEDNKFLFGSHCEAELAERSH